MTKYPRQDLRTLLDDLSEDCFPGIFKQLDPHYVNGQFLITLIGAVDTEAASALSKRAMDYLSGEHLKRQMNDEIFEQFSKSTKEERATGTFALSHELKMGAYAACIAYHKPDSHVYEIGSSQGFASIIFSNLMKKGNRSGSASGSIIAIERDSQLVKFAKMNKDVWGRQFPLGNIRFICSDAFNFLKDKVRRGDLLFASIAEPKVIEKLVDWQRTTDFNLLFSYSDASDEHVYENLGRHTEELIDDGKNDLFLFQDLSWSRNVPSRAERIGIFVESRQQE